MSTINKLGDFKQECINYLNEMIPHSEFNVYLYLKICQFCVILFDVTTQDLNQALKLLIQFANKAKKDSDVNKALQLWNQVLNISAANRVNIEMTGQHVALLLKLHQNFQNCSLAMKTVLKYDWKTIDYGLRIFLQNMKVSDIINTKFCVVNNVCNVPSGLSNPGNICYFNVILQTFQNVNVLKQLIMDSDDSTPTIFMFKKVLEDMSATHDIYVSQHLQLMKHLELDLYKPLDVTQVFQDVMDKLVAENDQFEQLMGFKSVTFGKHPCDCIGASASQRCEWFVPFAVDRHCKFAEAMTQCFAPSEVSDCKCPQCLEIHHVVRRQTILKAPPVFVLDVQKNLIDEEKGIYMQYFEWNLEDIPEILDLNEFVYCCDGNTKYTLQGFILYPNQNHYTAVFRYKNMWIKLDDEEVIVIGKLNWTKIEKQIRLVIYKQIDDIKDDIIVSDYKEGIKEDIKDDIIVSDYKEDVKQDYKEDVKQDYQEDVKQDYKEDVKQDYQEAAFVSDDRPQNDYKQLYEWQFVKNMVKGLYDHHSGVLIYFLMKIGIIHEDLWSEYLDKLSQDDWVQLSQDDWFDLISSILFKHANPQIRHKFGKCLINEMKRGRGGDYWMPLMKRGL